MRAILSLILFSLLSFQSISQVVITGKIRNYDGETELSYGPTIEGIHVPFAYTITPNADGTFKIKYENPGIGSIRIGFDNLIFRFVHSQNSKIHFEIDQRKIKWPKRTKRYIDETHWLLLDSVKQAATVVIRGDLEALNNYYNKSIRTSYGTPREVSADYYSQLIRFEKSPTKVFQTIDSLINDEKNRIAGLPPSIELENPTKAREYKMAEQFALNEVDAFYSTIFLKGINKKRQDQVSALNKDSTSALILYNREWEIVLEEFFEKAPDIVKNNPASRDYMEFLEMYSAVKSSYQEYHLPRSTKPVDEYIGERFSDSLALEFLDENAKFAYRVNGLHLYLTSEFFYTPVLLDAVTKLKTQHPKSEIIEHFNPQIEKLKRYVNESSKNFDGAKFVRGKYTSFNELLATLKGNNIFLDVWATWCIPCVQEFKHSETLRPFIEKNDLVVLYISMDKPEWKDRWKRNIGFNKLEGYHYLADEDFKKDLWNVLGGYQGSIPRYALIDKQGKIFLDDAPRPSDGEKLVGEIRKLVDFSK